LGLYRAKLNIFKQSKQLLKDLFLAHFQAVTQIDYKKSREVIISTGFSILLKALKVNSAYYLAYPHPPSSHEGQFLWT
jgi:hypothetical protein